MGRAARLYLQHNRLTAENPGLMVLRNDDRAHAVTSMLL